MAEGQYVITDNSVHVEFVAGRLPIGAQGPPAAMKPIRVKLCKGKCGRLTLAGAKRLRAELDASIRAAEAYYATNPNVRP